jgi:hypothetical protein
MIGTPNLKAFDETVQGRGSNDSFNSDRETAIELLLSPNSEVRDILLKKSPQSNEWQRISSAFTDSIREFVSTGGPGVPPTVGQLKHVIRLGGRNHNYDFEGYFEMRSGSVLKLKIELKRGDSIYDQPEFLQLYAKDGDLIAEKFPSYASWFYDNYLPSITMLAGTSIPSKTDYLNKCFGTNYEIFPHTNILYDLDIPGSTTKEKLKTIAFESIDSYLGELEQNLDMVDLDAIQNRMNSQIGKLFVSWNPKSSIFNVEMFSAEAMNLTSNISFKRRPNGQRSCLVVDNAAGNQIQSLLRWKNRNCLLGPAWQISLRTA